MRGMKTSTSADPVAVNNLLGDAADLAYTYMDNRGVTADHCLAMARDNDGSNEACAAYPECLRRLGQNSSATGHAMWRALMDEWQASRSLQGDSSAA